LTKLGRVRRYFSSPRRRRRTIKVGIVLALAALAAILGVFFANTGHRNETPFTKEKVQLVAPLPKTVKLSKGDARDALVVAAKFIATAVMRNHTERSYDLSDRNFHQGLTRAQWKTGDIPVAPYSKDDLDVVKWKLDYSYKDRVGLEVYLQPKPTAKVGGLAYNVELHHVGPPQHRRWLIDYWTPAGQQGPAPSKASASGAFGPPVQTKAGLAAIWLALPIGLVFGLILSVPLVLGIRGWRRRVRADRAYNALPQR
jgi:hypothetical protein